MTQVPRVNMKMMTKIIDNDELDHDPNERVHILLFELLRYHGIMIPHSVEPDVPAVVDEIILPAFYSGGLC